MYLNFKFRKRNVWLIDEILLHCEKDIKLPKKIKFLRNFRKFRV